MSTGAAVGESGRTCLLVELCVELDGRFAALQPNRTPVRDGLDLHTVAAVDLKTLQIHGAPGLNQQKKKPALNSVIRTTSLYYTPEPAEEETSD